MENPEQFAGKTVTLSVLYKMSDSAVSNWIGITVSGTDNKKYLESSTTWTLSSITVTIPTQVSSIEIRPIQFKNVNGPSNYTDIIAAKLELGPVQTLAHQDADGNWVLNDPPPNKATELLKCQRYQVVPTFQSTKSCIVGMGSTVLSPPTCQINIPLSTPLRTTPSVLVTGVWELRGAGQRLIFDVDSSGVTTFLSQVSTKYMSIDFNNVPDIITNNVYQLTRNNNNTAQIIIDANL